MDCCTSSSAPFVFALPRFAGPPPPLPAPSLAPGMRSTGIPGFAPPLAPSTFFALNKEKKGIVMSNRKGRHPGVKTKANVQERGRSGSVAKTEMEMEMEMEMEIERRGMHSIKKASAKGTRAEEAYSIPWRAVFDGHAEYTVFKHVVCQQQKKTKPTNLLRRFFSTLPFFSTRASDHGSAKGSLP